MRLIATMAVIAALFTGSTAYGVSYATPGSAYSQNFDGLASSGFTTLLTQGPHAIEGVLGSTGVVDWTMSNCCGSSVNTEFRAQDGSLSGSNGRGVVSFGTTGSGERALGVLPTSNQISRFGLSLTNDTGLTLNEFTLSYTGEQWRRGDDVSPAGTLAFAYALGAGDINSGSFSLASALDFAGPIQAGTTDIALDGNLAENQGFRMATITGLGWDPGEQLLVRWTGQDLTGQDDGLAIDDLDFCARVPEPTSLGLIALAGFALLASRQRK